MESNPKTSAMVAVPDLEQFLREIRESSAEWGVSKQPMRIPGLDSYVPSYLSSGTDVASGVHGELERDSQRNK